MARKVKIMSPIVMSPMPMTRVSVNPDYYGPKLNTTFIHDEMINNYYEYIKFIEDDAAISQTSW